MCFCLSLMIGYDGHLPESDMFLDYLSSIMFVFTL